jgi:hypothetical protein
MILKFYYAVPKTFPKTLFSKIMQIGENVDFGHVAIGLESYEGSYVYEAVMPRTRKMKLSEWDLHYKIVRQIQWTVPAHLQGDVYEYLQKSMGIRYSLRQILVIGLTCIFKPLDYFFKKVKLNNSKALICTEVQSRFAEKYMGFKLNKSHDEFGLEDSYHMGNLLEHNVKWDI